MKKYIDDELINELDQIHASDELKNKVLSRAKNTDKNSLKEKKIKMNYWSSGRFVAAAFVLCIVFNVWLITAIQDNRENAVLQENIANNENVIDMDIQKTGEVQAASGQTEPKKNNKNTKTTLVGSMKYVKTNNKLLSLVSKYIHPVYEYGIEEDFAVREETVRGAPTMADGNITKQLDTAEAEDAGGSITNELQDSPLAESDYSETNIQVKGVDESDIVKTDGKYIYYVNASKNELQIVDAQAKDDLKIAGKINFNNQNIGINEIYLDKNKLIVILSETIMVVDKAVSNTLRAEVDYAYNYNYQPKVTANVYDISDLSNITLDRTLKIDGNYISSRKINDIVYLVSNKYINYYGTLTEELRKSDIPSLLPSYEDTARGNKEITIKPKNILYTPDMETNAYTIIAGFNINDNEKDADITTILGNAYSVYASSENLYLTSNVYNNDGSFSYIYSFNLDNGKAVQKATGSVNGTLLNQYSMDEYNGYFRVATTTNGKFAQIQPLAEVASDESTKEIAPDTSVSSPAFSSLYNQVYILDDNLNIVGSLTDLAEDERIYSTRFYGDKLYMVTFKTIDPLFVIDLSNPTAPKVLGELKIPGYSNYLHMYDENHLIGIGQDTKTYTDDYGERTVNMGIKVALFDVSDVNNPIVKDEIILGGQGSYTTAAYDFKSVLFSKEKNLLAFPVTITEKGYDDYQFEGALVFDISIEKGLIEKGRITHQPNSNTFYGNNFIKRILYIGNTLFTLSDSIAQSSNISDCNKIDSISLK